MRLKEMLIKLKSSQLITVAPVQSHQPHNYKFLYQWKYRIILSSDDCALVLNMGK